MNKALIRIMGMLALAFMAATQTVRAQDPLLVNIPFEFTAGKMTLPPGEYRIQKSAQGSPALLIQRTDLSAVAYTQSFAARSTDPQTLSKLIFHRYGNHYFLSEVWSAGSSRGSQVVKSDSEKEQALVARHQKPDQVTIAARIAQPQP